MAERSKLFVVVFCLYFVYVTMVDASRKETKLKPKERVVNPAMESINKNISALWHEVEFLHQPIHIHIHGDGEVMKDPFHGGPERGHPPHEHPPRKGDDDDDDDKDDKKKEKKEDKKDGKKDRTHPPHDHKMMPGPTGRPMPGRHDHDHDHDHDHGHDHDHDHVHGHDHDHDHDRDGVHYNRRGAHVHIHLHTGEVKPKPRPSPPPDYLYARCDVAGNSALPKSEQQAIEGVVYFRQKPFQDLEVLVNVKGFPVKHAKNESSDHQHLHGIHIHEFADMTQGCTSMGGHFNPTGVSHGAPDAPHRHVGDWGNLVVNEEGLALSRFNDTVATLVGFETILGRGLVIHGAQDDLGLGGTEASLKTGNAGGRIACCVIIAVGPAPEVWG